MASIRHLPSAVVTKEEANNENLNWDETIANSDETFHPLLCLHATAHGSTVFGKNWSTSFAPHQVCHVASNHDGSIIVASTNGGNISLLRARDGQVLATRRVSEECNMTKSTAHVSFVAHAQCHHAKDILVISVPTNNQESQEQHVRLILVSNIDGQQLNDENMEAVTQAASKMSIDAIQLAATKDLEALQATFLNATTVRLAVGDCDGNVSIHDYDTLQKQATMVCENVLNDQEPVLTLLGIKLQTCGNDCVFVLFASGNGETSTKLYWYDLIHLNMACEYTLFIHKKKKPWLLDFEPVTSFHHSSSLAVAIAMKESSAASNGCIQVLQVCAEDTMGLTVLTRPHKVYQIPLQGSMKESMLQGVRLVGLEEDAGPYAFRFQTINFGAECDATCCEFVTSNEKIQDGIVGKIRMLIEREMYDEADELLASTNSNVLSSDTYANLHSTEVALRRFERLLSSRELGPEERMERAQEYLRRLIAGAVSSNELGLQHLVEAADCVIMWPSGTHQSTIKEFAMLLSPMISAINTALQSTKPEFCSRLANKKEEVENRLSAIKCIEALVETDPDGIALSAPFINVKSPSEVFLVLMEEGFFSVAQRFWRSEWGRHLTAETSAASILLISPRYDPLAYAAVLRDIVLPKLTITHEAIPLIRAWACRCANIYDDHDSELGLGASIFLLETVLDGMQQLNLQIHASYANYSPFLNKSKKQRHRSPRNATLDNTSSSFSSESSDKPCSVESGNNTKDSTEIPAPTILELGFLKGGAMKSKLQSISSRRSGDAASFIEDDAEDGEESLEIKLRHAQLLERARELGLSRDVVTLRDYLQLGGTDRVAKELVRIHSSAASGHDERFTALTLKVKPFCDESGVDYDQVLVSYNADLCDSRRTSVEALLESSSISRCCFAPLVKCQVALAVLRVALLCGKAPSCLTELSRDSIDWAAIDMTIKSELEEATRLLLVDSIVRKYCGHGARELFRVDNSLHAVRLLDFVSLHFRTKSVLSDLFDLCDAFTFLNREEACVQILQRAVASGDTDLCVGLLSTIFTLGDTIADRVCRQVLSYCCLELEEACSLLCQTEKGFQYDSFKERAVFACRVGRCIAEACYESSQEGLHGNTLLHPSFGALARDFGRLQRLQQHHSLFLPLSVFDSKQSTLKAARSLLDPIAESFARGNSEDILSLMTNAKAGCAILAGPNGNDCQSMWYSVAGEAASWLASTTYGGQCGDFLATAGILDDYGDADAVRAILSVALSLCSRASDGTTSGLVYDDAETLNRMEDVIRASSLVQDYALFGCPERTLQALVSLGLLTETASQVVLRADEGLGESLEILREKLRQEARARRNHSATVDGHIAEENGIDPLRVSNPLLHPSWYVGDGLLLSPREALSWSVAYCRDLFGFWNQGASVASGMDGAVGLHRFLGDRGAHTAALRISSVFSSISLSSGEFPQAFDGAVLGDAFVRQQRDTMKSLCERSLGGSGSGITSMTIDSQLAVAFLLSLPIKIAFKVYQASLPTAITKRDFPRVAALANIGVYAGEGKGGWETQKVFVSQCRDLASRARWWNILKTYEVEFDPSRFEENNCSSGKEGGNESPLSLVPQLIRMASAILQSVDLARNVAIGFVESFGLDTVIVAQKHVEFILSPACIEWDLQLCERSACDSLRLIHSPMKRCAVLRKCVITLENSRECDTDYERHAVVLSLYHTDLSLVVAKDPAIRDMDGSAFEDELEFIERRRDALAILSSYFQGEQKIHRPPFPSFFKPLHVPFNVKRGHSENHPCDILGDSGDREYTGSTFDPLQPLHNFFSFHMNEASAKALSPLTIPLGQPHGSIHVRCLVERLRRSNEGQATLPSFEHEVLPVLNRLKRSSDQSRLAEYCAEYYDDLDPQKLQCLDYAVEYAMTASSEVEKRLCFKTKSDDADLEADERRALDAVKRLSHKHSSLSDRLEVNGILQTATVGTSYQFSAVEKMVRDLTDRLQESFWKSADSSPEKFVEKLLVEASLLASNACLDQHDSFSITQLRHMASVVHQACKKISESYSHVHPGDISRSLARRWLVHGDETGTADARKSNPAENTTNRSMPEVSVAVSVDEDETVDFVMDLKDAKAAWSDDIGSVLSQTNDNASTVCQEEEPSALQPHGSSREASELDCTKVSLRVAFVMSFSEGYHKSNGEPKDEENDSSRANLEGKTLTVPPKRSNRPGLLSRLSTKDTSSSRSSVMLHARELLRIVFAKSEGTSVDPAVSFLSTSGSFANEAPEESQKTLTFAMRYRALRTVAVLCPQVALDKIIDEEGYLNTSLGGVECTLKKCTYGAFVAKEIEEMGLPLPHSNLIQLSTMHFPSYARALWRHHRNEDIRGKKGRLLLLLLEMSLRDNTDCELASTLLNEMSKLQLPRTILLGCECVAEYTLNANATQSPFFFAKEGNAVSNAVFAVANLVLSEAHRSLSNDDLISQEVDKGLTSTVPRVGNLVEIFSEGENGQSQVSQFVKVLVNLVALDKDPYSKDIAEIALSAIHCVSSVEIRRELLALLAQAGGQVVTCRQEKTNQIRADKVSTLSDELHKVEDSYRLKE